MNKTEGAKEFEIKLREIYDNRVKNDSLMILFNKVINSQPPNLNHKCTDKWEPLREPEQNRSDYELELYHPNGEMYNQFDFENFEKDYQEYKDALSYRERIEELERLSLLIADSYGVLYVELCYEKEQQIEQLTKDLKHKDNEKFVLANEIKTITKERDELKHELHKKINQKKEYRELFQAEKNKVKELRDEIEDATNQLISEEQKCHKLNAENLRIKTDVKQWIEDVGWLVFERADVDTEELVKILNR